MQYGARASTPFMRTLVGLTELCLNHALVCVDLNECRIGLPVLRVRVSLHILCRGCAQEGAMVNALCINNAA